MTIILTFATDDAIYQISDRLLSDFKTAAVVDNESNKAIVLNGDTLIAYTGRSQIVNKPTIEWLTQVIVGGEQNPLDRLYELIRSSASRDFHRQYIEPSKKHHAFTTVSWAYINGDKSQLIPVVAFIHNALDMTNLEWKPTPLDEFEVWARPAPIPSSRSLFFSLGKPLHPGERYAIYKLLQKCVRHRNSSRATIVEALFRSMDWLHRRYPKRIGEGCVLACLPKAAVEKESNSRMRIFLHGAVEGPNSFFLYRSASGRVTHHAPRIINGKSSFDFQAGYQ